MPCGRIGNVDEGMQFGKGRRDLRTRNTLGWEGPRRALREHGLRASSCLGHIYFVLEQRNILSSPWAVADSRNDLRKSLLTLSLDVALQMRRSAVVHAIPLGLPAICGESQAAFSKKAKVDLVLRTTKVNRGGESARRGLRVLFA